MAKVAGSNPAEPIPLLEIVLGRRPVSRNPFLLPPYPNREEGVDLSRGSVEGYGIFRVIADLVSKRHKLLVIVWVLVFVGALFANQVWRSGDVVSFSQTASLPQDTESAPAQRILGEQCPVHSQLGFTQTAAGIYWGIPDVFVIAWAQAPPPVANETAYSQARAAMNATLPPPTSFWAEASFETFYQGWRASFGDPGLAGASPS